MPRFSVIIPLFNKEKDILNTLKSVFEQTFDDFEILVIDDGSTDQGPNLVASLNNKKIKLITKKNEGVAPTRNFGVSKAQADYIAFLDADDFWYPNHLKNLNTLINTFPEAKWYLTAYEKKRSKNLITKMDADIVSQKAGWMGIVPDYFKNSLRDSLAWTSAVCMKKDFFNTLQGFDVTITNGAGEDTDLWLRAALQDAPAFINIVSAQHNLEGSNRISNTPTQNRVFMNLDKYEYLATKNPHLKKYLDVNRYALALQHKLVNDVDSFKIYTANIHFSNLNIKQKLLLKTPNFLLKILLKIQKYMSKKGIRLSSF